MLTLIQLASCGRHSCALMAAAASTSSQVTPIPSNNIPTANFNPDNLGLVDEIPGFRDSQKDWDPGTNSVIL